MELQLRQQPTIELPKIDTDRIKSKISDASLAYGVSVASKPLYAGVALPQARVKTQSLTPVRLSFYAVLFILWFADSTILTNYEGGLIKFVADCLSGFGTF